MIAPPHDAIDAPHAHELGGVTVAHDRLRTRGVDEEVLVSPQVVISLVVDGPAAKVRSIDHELGKGVEHAREPARMREVVPVVAGVDGDGQTAGDDLVELHEARVIRIDHLRVGMDLESVQAELYHAVDLGFLVLEIGRTVPNPMNSGCRRAWSAMKSFMLVTACDVVATEWTMKCVMGDSFVQASSASGVPGEQAPPSNISTRRRADGIDCLACDLLRIYVRVCVDNCHGFLLQRLPSYPNQEVWGR